MHPENESHNRIEGGCNTCHIAHVVRSFYQGDLEMSIRVPKLTSEVPTRIAILAALMVFCGPAWPTDTPSSDKLPASELLRKVVDSELKAEANDHSHWMYQVRERHHGKKKCDWLFKPVKANSIGCGR